MPTTVLKHLSRDFNIEPHKLRMILRKEFGKKKRWKWTDDQADELKRIREFLRLGKFTETSPRK